MLIHNSHVEWYNEKKPCKGRIRRNIRLACRNLGIHCRVIFEVKDISGRGESLGKVIEEYEYKPCLRTASGS